MLRQLLAEALLLVLQLERDGLLVHHAGAGRARARHLNRQTSLLVRRHLRRKGRLGCAADGAELFARLRWEVLRHNL